MRVHFVLIGEGTTDDALVPHLVRLCVECGADEATGVAPDFGRLPTPVGRTIAEKLRRAAQLEPTADLYFIHRDADARRADARRAEIAKGAADAPLTARWVPIVPVQETEAWLLLDETAIRHVAGKPRGRTPLNLPSPRQVENVANPKEKLQAALITASELTGRRLERFKAEFSRHRKRLLQRLPTEGALQNVPAWQQLRVDLVTALKP